MEVTIEADVDMYCNECQGPICDEDEMICRSCYEKAKKPIQTTAAGLLSEMLDKYFDPAATHKQVIIPAEEAFFLREKIIVALCTKE